MSKLLQNKKFVLTGVFGKEQRDELKKVIMSHGGHVSKIMDINVNYLITGKSPGSKLLKAKTLGVEIMSEEAFYNSFLTNGVVRGER